MEQAELRQKALEAIVEELAPIKERIPQIYDGLLEGQIKIVDDYIPLIPHSLSLFLELGRQDFISFVGVFYKSLNSPELVKTIEEIALSFTAHYLRALNINPTVFYNVAKVISGRNSKKKTVYVKEADYMFRLSDFVRFIYTDRLLDAYPSEFVRNLGDRLSDVDSNYKSPCDRDLPRYLLVKGPEFCLNRLQQRGSKAVHDFLLTAGREAMLEEAALFVDHAYKEAGDYVKHIFTIGLNSTFDEEHLPSELLRRFGRASWSLGYCLKKNVWNMPEEDKAIIARNTEIFNITHVHRYVPSISCFNNDSCEPLNLSLLEQNLRNWDNPDPEKPVAVFIYNQNDYNQAFDRMYESISALQGAYAVYLFEANTSYSAMIQAKRLSSHVGRKIDLLFIGGHGTPHSILMGPKDTTDNYIDFSWFIGTSSVLADDAMVITYACDAGKETVAGNLFNRLIDKRTYLAPKGCPQGFKWIFNEKWLVTSVEFNCNEGTACYTPLPE